MPIFCRKNLFLSPSKVILGWVQEVIYTIKCNQSRASDSERGFGSSGRLTYVAGYLWTHRWLNPCGWNFLEHLGGGVESDLGPKKIQNFEIEIFFTLKFFFLSSCTRTLSDLCTCDDSLGFEDCCFATHLLNCALKALLYAYFVLC